MEAISTKKLLRNFFSLSFVQGINSLLQLLIVPYVITGIGVENFGKVAVAQVVMFFLGAFTEYGFGQVGAREVSLNRIDKQKLSVIFYNSLYTKLLLCGIAFAALLLLAAVFPVMRQHPVLYGMAFLYVIGQASFPSWFFQGMEKMQWVAISTLFSKLLFVALVFLFIKRPEHAVLYTFFLGLGNLIAGIVSSVVAVRMFGLHPARFSSQRVISTLKESWPITVTNLSANFIQYGNLFILRLFSNDLIAGYFSVAERIYFAMKQVLTAFSQTIYPNICRLAEEGGGKLKHYFKKIFIPFFIMTILTSLAVMLLAPYIISFFLHGNSCCVPEHTGFPGIAGI
jgi:PST family polysaccharide transporter